MEKTAIELFAGVGGFRVGLNHVTLGKDGKAIEKPNFKFLWANQWEPATKSQEAFDCYKARFSKGNDDEEFSNIDISLVNKKDIPDFTLLTGGFPCQDYSVAHGLASEKGIQGKKGVLWWQINDIIIAKKPPFILLENVDRLLKSPSKQRGRDFGIMLKCLYDNGYCVEWRVINAAEYGHPQKRRRTYIFAFRSNTKYAKGIKKHSHCKLLLENGLFAQTFSAKKTDDFYEIDLKKYKDIYDVSDNFKFDFCNSGCMIDGIISTAKLEPIFEKPITLNEIILNEKIDSKYFLTNAQDTKFSYLKGAKKIQRKAKNGFTYAYSEGSMSFPDSYDNPGRTMLTSEGTINRSTHVIEDRLTKKHRLLTPVECERLNQFPDNWTNTMNDRKRYFMMGNALVTGIIKKLGKVIEAIIEKED